MDSENEVSTEILKEYEKLLKKSYTENFDELFKTDLLKVLGKDGYGYNIVLLIPCFIAATEADPEKTLRYAIMRMDSVVRENYVLILCETHTGWLMDTLYIYAKQWYDVLPRMYKKNLKKLYLVHSGFMSKTFLTVLSPFLSANFWKKVEYVQKLEDIFFKLNVNPTNYLRYFPYIVQRTEEIALGVEPISFFGADLEILCQRFGKPYLEFKNIPSLLVNFLEHLTKPEIINTKDLFSLQTDAATLYGIVGDIEYGEPTTDFDNIPALVCSFKLFLDVQKNGLLGKGAFARLHEIKNNNGKQIIKMALQNLYNKLEPGTQQCVLCLLRFFKKVSLQANTNNMTPEVISKTFAATFFRPRKPYINFQECIPIANRCLLALILDPDILINNDEVSDSDDGDDDESSESKSSGKTSEPKMKSKIDESGKGDIEDNKSSSGGSSDESSSDSDSSSSSSSSSASNSNATESKKNKEAQDTKEKDLSLDEKRIDKTEKSKNNDSDADDSADDDDDDDSSSVTSVSHTEVETDDKGPTIASNISNNKETAKENFKNESSLSKKTSNSSVTSDYNESSEEESEEESENESENESEEDATENEKLNKRNETKVTKISSNDKNNSTNASPIKKKLSFKKQTIQQDESTEKELEDKKTKRQQQPTSEEDNQGSETSGSESTASSSSSSEESKTKMASNASPKKEFKKNESLQKKNSKDTDISVMEKTKSRKESESNSEFESESESESDSDTKAESETKSESNTKSEFDTKSVHKIPTKPQLKTKTNLNCNSNSSSNLKNYSNVKSKSKSESESDDKSESTTKSESKTESKYSSGDSNISESESDSADE